MKFLQTLVCALALPVTVLAQNVVTGTVVDTAGAPLAGIYVSDGHTVATTDASGTYTLSTPLDLGYVFVSTPDGYEPATRLGNRPCFWQSVSTDAAVADFVLEKLPARRPLAVIAVADPQISNRCDDVRRLRELYVPDINRSVDSLRTAGLEPIVLTLGDQICDFFVAHGYGYTLDRFNDDFKVDAPVYHTIGNHDNDPFIEGDVPGASTWHRINGPSYYSFSRGGAHFISIDNMVYFNKGASDSVPGNRKYTTALTDEQLKWIAADLATIRDKAAPLFLMMHGVYYTFPVAGHPERVRLRIKDGGEKLDSLLQDFTNVKILSGHAHNSHYQHGPDGRIREYNYAASCGTWWPAKVQPYCSNTGMCTDGTPWGYGIWNLATPHSPAHLYKGYGKPASHQIRAYDLNTIHIADTILTSAFQPGDARNRNAVLANVWAFEPGCTVRMFEDGKELNVEQVMAQDPLHFIRNAVPVKEQRGNVPKALLPERTAHMFRATATTATAPVTVEFTDLSGRTFSTVLQRPVTPVVSDHHTN